MSDLGCTLLPHQINDSERILKLLETNGSACDRSEMGTGKTFTAARVVQQLGLGCVVICPKSTIISWERVLYLFPRSTEFGLLENEARTVINYEGARLGKCPHYNPKTGWRRDRKLLIIFDEAHRLRARGTLQTKMLERAREAGHYILLLSATLATKATDLLVIGYSLGLFLDKRSGFQWARRYGAFINHWGALDSSTSIRHLLALNQALDNKGVRTTIAELGHDLPSTTYPELVSFGRTPQILRDFEILESELTGEPGSDLAYRVACRQLVEHSKLPELASETEDLVDNGYSVILFVNFRESLHTLATRFPQAATIYGGQDGLERQRNIDTFQTNKTKILIANIKAGGIGLSLHDTEGDHPRVSLISPPESAIDLIQCVGRTCRVGMRSPAVNRILCAAGTIEEQVFKNVAAKIDHIETINDGDLDPVLPLRQK